MEIVDERKNKKLFKELKEGDVFQFENSIMIKTEQHLGDKFYVNCVRIPDGAFSYFSNEALVEQLNIKIIIT